MKLEKEQLITLYRHMVRVRKLDETITHALYTGTLPGFYHPQIGQEAVGVGACSFLRKDDYLFYTHRGHGIGKVLPKGVEPRRILAEHYGRASGCCGGLSGFHTADMSLGIPGISGTIGPEFVLSAGFGYAAKMRGQGQIVMCIQGEGATGRGTFHEGMLMSANWKLPVVWVIENNLYMVTTPVSELYPKENFADLAFGYGIPSEIVDGQDVLCVYEAVQKAIDRARAGDGPSLIECKTYRIPPHALGLPDIKTAKPRPQDEIEPWKKRDPILLFGEKLLREGILTEVFIDQIDREATAEMEEANRFAMASPNPSPEILDTALYAA